MWWSITLSKMAARTKSNNQKIVHSTKQPVATNFGNDIQLVHMQTSTASKKA
jgi:hypothetical protein